MWNDSFLLKWGMKCNFNVRRSVFNRFLYIFFHIFRKLSSNSPATVQKHAVKIIAQTCVCVRSIYQQRRLHLSVSNRFRRSFACVLFSQLGFSVFVLFSPSHEVWVLPTMYVARFGISLLLFEREKTRQRHTTTRFHRISSVYDFMTGTIGVKKTFLYHIRTYFFKVLYTHTLQRENRKKTANTLK